MVFVSFGTVTAALQHLRPFVTALLSQCPSRRSTVPAVCTSAPSPSLLSMPGLTGTSIGEIAHSVCTIHGVLFRLSVSAVASFCLCFTGLLTTRCFFCRRLFRNGPLGSPSYYRNLRSLIFWSGPLIRKSLLCGNNPAALTPALHALPFSLPREGLLNAVSCTAVNRGILCFASAEVVSVCLSSGCDSRGFQKQNRFSFKKFMG
jgi:hypothetical protein